MYKVNEIFYSLQGEGYFTGTPAVFLRLSGCNLKCDFCDTTHGEFREMSPIDIINEIKGYPSRHIVVTGGEPSLQLDDMLVDILHDEGFFVQVETNGTHPLPESVDWVTCSPKSAPDNSCSLKLKHIDELKIVYLGQDVEAVAQSISSPLLHLFLQPCSHERYPGGVNLKETVDYILDHPHWRLSLQTHKLINIP